VVAVRDALENARDEEETRMKTPIVVILLGLCLLAATNGPAFAQASGPTCLHIVEFAEVVRLFALPTGGGQAILTGESVTFGDAYSGSGYVTGNSFVFTLVSGLLPGLLEGTLNLGTGTGSGSATLSDTGDIQSLSYSAFAPPCVLP
jgi:hypothetical protein